MNLVQLFQTVFNFIMCEQIEGMLSILNCTVADFYKLATCDLIVVCASVSWLHEVITALDVYVCICVR